MNHRSHTSQLGASHLVMVLVIATMLVLILSGIQVLAFVGTKLAARVDYSQRAYFAAEGALFESVNHIKSNPSWPGSFPYEDSYIVNTTTIYRTITKNADGTITIETQADSKGAARKFRASLTPSATTTTTTGGPLDIVVVIDNSGSMHRLSGSSSKRAYENAQIAAKGFVDILATTTTDTNIGLVRFQDPIFLPKAYSVSQLAPLDKNALVDVLDTYTVNSSAPGTWLTEGIKAATKEFKDRGRANAQKVMVILSDGVATGFWEDSGQTDEKWCEPVHCWPQSQFAPSNYGNICTQSAISAANTAKSTITDLKIVTVFFNNISDSTCTSNQIKQRELGRLAGFQMSSETGSGPLTGQEYDYYKETDSADDLPNIFEDLAGEIITVGGAFGFKYHEVEPQVRP